MDIIRERFPRVRRDATVRRIPARQVFACLIDKLVSRRDEPRDFFIDIQARKYRHRERRLSRSRRSLNAYRGQMIDKERVTYRIGQGYLMGAEDQNSTP